MPTKTYSSQEARERSGATTRQLYHWHDNHLIHSIDRYKNTTIEFTLDEVKVITRMVSLVKLGFLPITAERIARKAEFVGAGEWEYTDKRFTIRWKV